MKIRLKCIGCGRLQQAGQGEAALYNCDRLPYPCSLGGLLYPGKSVEVAAKNCSIKVDSHCVLCAKRPVTRYGNPAFAWACEEHHEAWGKWLAADLTRHQRINPRGRLNLASWVSIFREFVEECRNGR